MRDSRIGARQRVGAYPQSQTRRSSGQTVTTADGPTTRRVVLLAICTTSSMGAATGCFGVATSMSPFPLSLRAALGRLEVRAAATRSRARASSLSPGPPGCIRSARAGGATGSDGDCVARAGEGAVWYRRARRRSHVVLAGLGLVRCAPGTGGVGCRRFGLSAPRIRRVQAERGISGCASRLLQAGLGCHRSAPDLHRVGSRRRPPSALQKVRRFR